MRFCEWHTERTPTVIEIIKKERIADFNCFTDGPSALQLIQAKRSPYVCSLQYFQPEKN